MGLITAPRGPLATPREAKRISAFGPPGPTGPTGLAGWPGAGAAAAPGADPPAEPVPDEDFEADDGAALPAPPGAAAALEDPLDRAVLAEAGVPLVPAPPVRSAPVPAPVEPGRPAAAVAGPGLPDGRPDTDG